MATKQHNMAELLTPAYIFCPDISIDKDGRIYKALPDEPGQVTIGTFKARGPVIWVNIRMILYCGLCLMDEFPLSLHDVFSQNVSAEKDGTLTVSLGAAKIMIGSIDEARASVQLTYPIIKGYVVTEKRSRKKVTKHPYATAHEKK